LQISEIRTIARDALWMSTAQGRDSEHRVSCGSCRSSGRANGRATTAPWTPANGRRRPQLPQPAPAAPVQRQRTAWLYSQPLSRPAPVVAGFDPSPSGRF
jgi:hypothetical protein